MDDTLKCAFQTPADERPSGGTINAFATPACSPPVIGAWIFLGALLLIFVLGELLFAVGEMSAVALVVLLSLQIPCIAGWAILLQKTGGGQLDIFAPAAVIDFMSCLYYCIRPLYLLDMKGRVSLDVFIAMNPATNADLAEAIAYASLGLIFFHLGFYFFTRRSAGSVSQTLNRRRWNSRRAGRAVFAGAVLATISACVAVSVAGGISGTLANVGRLRELTAGFGYCLLGAAYFPIGLIVLVADHLNGHRRGLWIFVFLVLSIVYAVVFGNRTGIFAVLLSCFIVYVYLTGIKRVWRFTFAVIGCCAIVVPAVVFLGFARQFNVGVAQLVQVGRVMQSEGLELFYEQTMSEFNAVDALAAMLHGGSNVFPPKYGQTYADVVEFLIPRAVWPNKPKAFSTAVGDYVTENGNDVPPGVIGELYANFRQPGVAAGMMLLGLLMGYIYSHALNGTVGSVIIYAFLLPYFGVFLSRNFLGGGILTLTTVLPILPVILYIEFPDRRRVSTSTVRH